ncbi:hypothetical protein WK07_09345 [Burkholderia multivorans]|nr:hypothetical protein WK07_09345 [Burkholderia multivorans]
MGTRILWQAENRSNDADFEGVTETYAAMLKFAHQVARPDTEITLRYMEEAPRSFANNLIYPRAVTKVQVVNRVVEAEREGFDAALAGVCIIDAYSQECRQTVRMPVLGGAESTMLMAQLVGKRFAWVTIAPSFIEPFEAHIRQHGWADRSIRRAGWRSSTRQKAGPNAGSRCSTRRPRLACATVPIPCCAAAIPAARCWGWPAIARCATPACRSSWGRRRW